MLKIMIVDDHPVVRSGLAAMLCAEDDMDVVSTHQGGDDAAKWLASCQPSEHPDVIVCDVHMPHGDGFQLLASIRNAGSSARLLMLAGMPLKEEENRAREDGAAGYLPKSLDGRKLIDAIREVCKASALFVVDGFEQEEGLLTDKELAVLRYASEGKTREETGLILGISAETVKSHLRMIMRKLDTVNTTASVGRAYELGLLRA